MKITPEKIREVYNRATPYQRQEILANYVGQKVDWQLNYFSVDKSNEYLGVSSLSPSSGLIGQLVRFNIKEADFPIIKVLPADSQVQVVGTISSIDEIAITLVDVSVRTLNEQEDQVYFPAGSREELISLLESKIFGAEIVKICDPYISVDILKLLENNLKLKKTYLLGKEIDESFVQKTRSFNIYFDKNIYLRKTNTSHARFYIIDDDVFQVDSSLKNFGGNKATMVHKINNTSAAIKKDFDNWWAQGEQII